MQSTHQTASLPAHRGDSAQSRKVEDVAYQALTVAAALLLLGSLWLF
jgi:hypothetical protein